MNNSKLGEQQYPWDRWISIASLVIGVGLWLVPKTGPTVVLGILLMFGGTAYLLWTLPWVRDTGRRRLLALALLLIACLTLGIVTWPEQIKQPPTAQQIVDEIEIRRGNTGEKVREPTKPEDIAAFASRIVISSREGGQHWATGFWVDRPRFAVLCSASALPSARRSRLFSISIPTPTFMGELGEGGAHASGTAPSISDDGEVILLAVPQNDLTSKQKYIEIENPRTGARQRMVEEFVSPILSTSRPSEGEPVYLYGVERNRISLPSFSLQEGKVVGISLDNSIRIRASLDFKPSYCGAPVLNQSKQVIGMAIGRAASGDVEIVPASDIVHLMRRVRH